MTDDKGEPAESPWVGFDCTPEPDEAEPDIPPVGGFIVNPGETVLFNVGVAVRTQIEQERQLSRAWWRGVFLGVNIGVSICLVIILAIGWLMQ